MAKQLGRLFLIKIENQGVPGTYVSLCGLTSKKLAINNAPIDVTTPDCTTPGGVMWEESLAGVKSVSVSGDGKFTDEASEADLNTVAMSATATANFQIIIPDFGTYAGTFRVNVEFSGGDGVDFSLSLQSTGTVTFTAA